jgi:hypothetical protein
MHAILIATAALVGLPILLHLLMKQEPKRLPFPALRLLKIKQKTNQRKLRLRHFLLLALRMLLIALFGIALYQPTLMSDGSFLRAEQPVVAVLIIDTSPSMGYRAGGNTRLEEARRRAIELLDDLPEGSRIAIVDPNDPAPVWELTKADARAKIELLKEPGGAAVPMTTALATAYQLLRNVDQESDETEPLPRLVALFTDRTTASWDATRNDDLVKLRDSIPPPAVAHAVFDIGVDKPANVGIVSVEMKPQLIPAGQTARLAVTVAASGPDVLTAVVRAKLDDGTTSERKAVQRIVGGGSSAVVFEFADLARGVHHVEFSLETDDNLPADNVRYFTFKVAEPRKILTISDNPDDAGFWEEAHKAKGEFECDVKTPDQAGEWTGYDAVCLLNVADPGRPLPGGGTLWDHVKTYLARGGKVILLPGPNARIAAYDAAKTEFLPGTLKTIISTVDLFDRANDPRFFGVTWATSDDADLKHPLLAEYVKWKRQGNVEAVKNPRKAWRYWELEPAANSVVVMNYNDADERAKRRPAILEKQVGAAGGKVLLFATRYDPQYDRNESWNDIWQDVTWAVAFPHQLLVYLAGSASDANFNYTTGEAIPVPIPKSATAVTKLQITGPGVTARDAEIDLGEKQVEVRLPSARTGMAGNFRILAGSAREGFSLNPPGRESDLTKADVPPIEAVCGPNSVIPVEKTVSFRDLIESKFNQPVDLFPWLVILVLILIALEGVIANRFYRRG